MSINPDVAAQHNKETFRGNYSDPLVDSEQSSPVSVTREKMPLQEPLDIELLVDELKMATSEGYMATRVLSRHLDTISYYPHLKQCMEAICQSSEATRYILEYMAVLISTNTEDLTGEPQESFNLTKKMEQVLNNITGVICSKQAKVKFHLAPDIPSQLRGNFSIVMLTLVNLVRNAEKHNPSRTLNIEIFVQLQHHAAMHSRVCLLFSVKDNGIGIPSGELPHIFEPGFKGATQRDLPGRGLGLYFAQKLVQKMGGSIWADSRGFHRGVTFSFTAIFEKLE